MATRILKHQLLGLATCWTRPRWKFWIRIYRITLEDGRIGVVCRDCMNYCDNFEIWLKFYPKSFRIN